MDWHLIVPAETSWAEDKLARAREVRLRPGQPVTACLPEGVWQGAHILTPEEVARAAQALSGHALAARQRELAAGFLPLAGGHRLGVCGVMGEKGLLEISSLCLRMARQVRGAGGDVFPRIRGKNTLILGAPGAGKTTLLRDIARLYSRSGVQVGIADDRGEIAACREGTPQLDVGPMTDVVTGMDKARGLMLLIRAMAPQVIITDELGTPRDGQAVLEAIHCGVTVVATAHGRSLPALRKRRGMAELWAQGAFERFVLLAGPGAPPRVLGPAGEEA